MKEFCNILKQTGKVTWGNAYMAVSWSVIAAIIGMGGDLFLYYQDGVWCEMGGVMSLIFLALMVVFAGFVIFPADFMQALSMGKTRKYVLPAHYCMWIRNTFMALLSVLGIKFIEKLMRTHLAMEVEYIMDETAFVYNPLVFSTIVICVPAVILFCGGLILFFGIKLLWGIFALFVLCAGSAKFEDMLSQTAIMQWQNSLTGAEPNVVVICFLCLIGAAILLAFAWLMLRKQRVTF
ncbi:MAG: hypothetical protein IKK33_08820 [Lachnospiraceae bacterium]|nr:hypothetical protein [Lachnospiraceae bacterium]